ncbi:MAG TPA: carbohydrate isomerase [Ruminococcaceae bacterium]|nr:carbohydrate isomerase [Oscillospiraceae bacterium]
MDALKSFIDISRTEFDKYADGIDCESVKAAAELIIDAKKKGGRLHITGIGKPAHIAGYAASLISSTGTPAYFLHGTEAVHGSCGQLAEGDVVICISNSGETAELKATAMAIKNNGCKIISVTGNPDSWLGKYGEVCLAAGVEQQGGVLNRAPRASILAETYILQCLSVVLQESVNITPAEYVKRHPGGSLGQLRENERQN